jgi:transposase InsO family protein
MASNCISSTRLSGKQSPGLFSDPPNPTRNAHTESFNGRYRDECLNRHWFTSLREASEIVEDWRIDYNAERSPQQPEISNAGGVRSREALR